MILHVLRALFVLLMAAAGWFFLDHSAVFYPYSWLALAISLSVGVFIVCVDILAPRRKLQIFSGTILGLLVGLLLAYALSFVIQMIVGQYFQAAAAGSPQEIRSLTLFINLVVGLACCYLSISFILQTKDDFRFIVPYVEFSKQTKGARPMLVDTSVLIDGRISDIAATGIVDSRLIVPRFVLDELQTVADSGDKLKRARGRRGLDVLSKVREIKHADLIIYDSSGHEEGGVRGVDQKLISLALQLNARLLTTDFNLKEVGQLRGVDVIDLNDLGRALKPVVLPGERLAVRLVREGEEPGQGVGYLEDGTMVVIEQGRAYVGDEVEFTVTKLLQTTAGRLVFGRLAGDPNSPAPRQRQPSAPTS